ncbi:hypothetical protein [Noviherbaspirillum sp.]|jgi:hypothetical protein|nr:hypothetical protein [Noviherbaspirillum sp.]
MLENSQKFFIAFVATFIFSATPNVHAEKIYSQKERQAEEARIQKDIEKNLDWRNRTPDTSDELPDADRWLYGRSNESILLRQSTGERFGIFESFDDKNNTKIFEIRMHKKSKLTGRFRPFQGNCEGESISAELVAAPFVLYQEMCAVADGSTEHSLYLYDYASRGLYWIYSATLSDYEKPKVTYKDGAYRLRWKFRLIGNKEQTVITRNFQISKVGNGNWAVKDLPPINEEIDGVTPVEKLPLKTEYDLPAFVADWGKR